MMNARMMMVIFHGVGRTHNNSGASDMPAQSINKF